jgi:hypothetical protein
MFVYWLIFTVVLKFDVFLNGVVVSNLNLKWAVGWKSYPLIFLNNKICLKYSSVVEHKKQHDIWCWKSKSQHSFFEKQLAMIIIYNESSRIVHCTNKIPTKTWYSSSLPVLHYLQAVLYIKFWIFSWISYTILFKIRRYQIPFKTFMINNYNKVNNHLSVFCYICNGRRLS